MQLKDMSIGNRYIYMNQGSVIPKWGTYVEPGDDNTALLDTIIGQRTSFQGGQQVMKDYHAMVHVPPERVLVGLLPEDANPSQISIPGIVGSSRQVCVHPHVRADNMDHALRDGFVLEKPHANDERTQSEVDAHFDGTTGWLLLENRHPKRRMKLVMMDIQNIGEVKAWLASDAGLTFRGPIITIDCKTNERTLTDMNWPHFKIAFNGPYIFEHMAPSKNELI